MAWSNPRDAAIRLQRKGAEAQAMDALRRMPEWATFGQILNRKHQVAVHAALNPFLDERQRAFWVDYAVALRMVLRLADTSVDEWKAMEQSSQLEDMLAAEETDPPNPHQPRNGRG